MLWSRPLGYMFSICWKNIGSSIWMKHLNKTGNIVWIEEVKSFLKNNCDTEIWEGGWTALNDALHLSTYCFFFCKNTASYLREYLVFKAVILKTWNLSKKRSCKKWEEGWTSLKDVLHLSTHCSFLARILFLI